MEIGVRFRLSESSEWLACFREGMFIRFYNAHLGWFCQQGKPLKVLRRSFKKLEGRVVLYGGLPQASFQAWLLTQHPALAVQEQPWGCSCTGRASWIYQHCRLGALRNR